MKSIFSLINKKSFSALFLFISINTAFAQLAAPFKVRHQGYVKGDMTIIANNIVNRVDYNNEANAPYNNRAMQGKLNDEFIMMYVDIDNDKTTFSSSSADLVLENATNKKIVYAGLYWSATYLYNSGKSPDTNKFKAIDSKREPFDKIKIKLPNQDKYTDINGELIFDGIKENNFKESAPYSMYADITNIVKASQNPFGTYTVANIKSTVGEISGGVSAGWTIFFVYEDESMSGKFITSYDGFAGVTEKSTDILFSGFQTLPEGNVNAKIACAALEGDLNLKGDQYLFRADEMAVDFTQLSNTLRDKSNVFNSSITIDNAYFDNRFPNSKNTLGYDSFIMSIDNNQNSVIGNNTTDATLRLKTFGDRYFVFFNAFSVEAVKPKTDLKEPELITSSTNQIKPPDKPQIITETIKPKPVEVAVVTPTKIIEVKKPEEIKVVTPEKVTPVEVAVTTPTKVVEIKKEEIKAPIAVATTTPVVTATKVETSPKLKLAKLYPIKSNVTPTESLKKTIVQPKPVHTKTQRIAAIESPPVMIASLPEGYYIIVNVFAIHNNATRFVSKLKQMGLNAEYFINPINNYRYVYVSKHNDFIEASNLYASNINGKYYNDLWIMTVNKRNNPDFVVANYSNNDEPVNGNQTKTNTLASVSIVSERRKNIIS